MLFMIMIEKLLTFYMRAGSIEVTCQARSHNSDRYFIVFGWHLRIISRAIVGVWNEIHLVLLTIIIIIFDRLIQ